MNIVERGRAFLQTLRELASRSVWDWRRCVYCGATLTCKWGAYTRRPWFFAGRQTVRVQRHRCGACRRTYAEQSALLVRGGWYAREVRRCAVDHWQHAGVSVRRTAELLRSWLGRQERWGLWRPLDPAPAAAQRCWLSASTVQRWLDQAGAAAAATVAEQLAGATCSGQLATDGLWATLGGGTKRVVLALVDGATGLVWPPVVVASEATAAAWAQLFARAQRAGLALAELRGLVSDGAAGLERYRREALPWVSHQRCVFHLWRGLAGTLRQAVAETVAQALEQAAGSAAQGAGQGTETAKALSARVAKATRRVLVGLIRAVFDANSVLAAKLALGRLAAAPYGEQLAREVAEHLEAALVHRCGYNQGLGRVSPEWLWRDFRLRLSHGRNHRTAQRLERAALVWAVYRNFQPAQERSERKRTYRRPGQSPLALAGLDPGSISYLDALAI